MLVVLIGYRGTGKSTIGKLLAQKLRCAFVDTDEQIQRRAGVSIAELFAAEGEAGFRDWENVTITELSRRFRGVMSLGGGAVLRAENISVLKPPGVFVWLQATPETIAKRVNTDPNTTAQRPQLTDRNGLDEIVHVLTEREPIYRACADRIVDTEGKAPEQIAAEIMTALPAWDSEHDLTK